MRQSNSVLQVQRTRIEERFESVARELDAVYEVIGDKQRRELVSQIRGTHQRGGVHACR